jgi:hypothetical protein
MYRGRRNSSSQIQSLRFVYAVSAQSLLGPQLIPPLLSIHHPSHSRPCQARNPLLPSMPSWTSCIRSQRCQRWKFRQAQGPVSTSVLVLQFCRLLLTVEQTDELVPLCSRQAPFALAAPSLAVEYCMFSIKDPKSTRKTRSAYLVMKPSTSLAALLALASLAVSSAIPCSSDVWP